MLWRKIIGNHELEQGDSNLFWEIRESLSANLIIKVRTKERMWAGWEIQWRNKVDFVITFLHTLSPRIPLTRIVY